MRSIYIKFFIFNLFWIVASTNAEEIELSEHDKSVIPCEDCHVITSFDPFYVVATSQDPVHFNEYEVSQIENWLGELKGVMARFTPTPAYLKLISEPRFILVRNSLARDAYFHTATPNTIYAMTRVLKQDSVELLAHEMFHLLHFQYRAAEEDWLKEALAYQFESFIGKAAGNQHAHNLKVTGAFWNQSEAPMIEPTDYKKPNLARDGKAFLFVKYLSDQCGKGLEFFWQLAFGTHEASSLTPIETQGTGEAGLRWIQSVLESLDFEEDHSCHPDTRNLQELFRDYAFASVIDKESRAHGKRFYLRGSRRTIGAVDLPKPLSTWNFQVYRPDNHTTTIQEALELAEKAWRNPDRPDEKLEIYQITFVGGPTQILSADRAIEGSRYRLVGIKTTDLD